MVGGITSGVVAPPEGFSGDIPLLPQDKNVTLARWMFGFGSLVSLAMFGYAMQLFFGATPRLIAPGGRFCRIKFTENPDSR
jgi:hypothetical protein